MISDAGATAYALPGGRLREAVLQARRAGRGLTLGAVIAFAAGAAMGVRLQVGGHLLLTEILLAAVLPFLLAMPGRAPLDHRARAFVTLALTWLWSQVITDLVRHSAFHDYSRGWSRIAFTLVSFCALTVLLGDDRVRMSLFAIGLSIGLLVAYARYGIPQGNDTWKFGVGFPLTLGGVVFACTPLLRRIPLAAPVVLLGLAALNLVQGFRSLGGICFVASAYLLLSQFTPKRQALPNISLGRVIAISLVVLTVGVVALDFYSYLARNGTLGQAQQQKYEEQTKGKFGLLLGGRPQTLSEIRAALDSPIVGHGAWAKNSKYTLLILRDLQRAGYEITPGLIYGTYHSDSIPTHSFLLGAWVEAGLLGAVFWLGVLILVLPVFFILYRIEEPLAPLLAFLLVNLVWGTAFSPYGTEERIIVPFSLVVLLWLRRRASALQEDAAQPAQA